MTTADEKSYDEVNIPAQVKQGENHVLIEFAPFVPRQAVEEQVEACRTETCECCTPEFREQVDGFEVIEDEDALTVRISGSISAEHVKENMVSCAPKLQSGQ